MYNLKILLLSILLLPVVLLSSTIKGQEPSLALFYSIDKDIEQQFNLFTSKKLKSINFNLSDPHKRVNDQYETKYGSTMLDLLSFMPIVNDKMILPLLNIDPRIAGFAPFNMLIYKKLDENTTHIGHLMPNVMLDILDIKNQEVREKFTASFTPLNKSMENFSKKFNGIKTYIPYKSLPKKTMINYEYKFEAPEEMDEFLEELQNKFELSFINKGYLIAGYHNFMDSTDDAEEILSGYDAFWTYSLCHLKFSYGMFDNNGSRPEAGLFAPCTMYMYIKKGTNTLIVGMFRLHNWSATLDIKDKKRIALIEQLDSEIPKILEDFGMRAIENRNELFETPLCEVVDINKTVIKTNTNIDKEENNRDLLKKPLFCRLPTVPKVPTVPKAIRFGNGVDASRGIKFSKRVPPNYIAHRFDKMKKMKISSNTRIGDVNKGRISAYLRGEFVSVKDVEKRLKSAGFNIIASVSVEKKKTLISVVFTSKELLEMADKDNRGFMASLRVLVDKKKKRISITNPIYMAKGFLQDDYNDKEAKKVLHKLLKQFPKLKNSKDLLKFQLLPKYQFMNGMPQYQDMIEVASGDDLEERVKNNKKILFTQRLNDGSMLVGVKLNKRTNKFTRKIGTNNAGMLPYPVIIKDGKAIIMDPKYYISYMYPLLKMSQFMKIATIPDAMVKDCERAFRKRRKR
ncbi:MAG: hypothetical protein QM493_10105 [Sulfurovum sp.]